MIERRYGKIVNMCSFTAHGIVSTIPGYCAAFGGILYVDSLSDPDGPVPTYLDLLKVTTETIAKGLAPAN